MSRLESFPSIDPIQIAFEGKARSRKCRPSGRNDGNLCALSPRDASGVVTADAWPPEAMTLKTPPARLPNRMTPSRFHVPPRNNEGASQTVLTPPPETSTVLILPAAENPMVRLLVDQNGCEPPSVPAIGCASSAPSGRTQI